MRGAAAEGTGPGGGPALGVRLLIVATIALALVLGVGGPASAETTLEITTPADGRYQAGQATPLLVTIQADRAISGTLRANFEGFRSGSQRVEVPGGSAKQVVFIVTIPPWSGAGQVTFSGDDSADDASARINLIAAGGDELVGVSPELAARELPGSADVDVDIGVARLFPFDPTLLASGREVLSPFSQVIATSGDLAALDDAQQEAIESWVGADGGILIVDDEPGTPLPFEQPDPGQTGDASSVAFGLGEIRFSNGQAAAGAYDGLFRPTPSRSFDEFPWSGGFGGGFPSTSLLATDAGIRIPAIGSLMAVLLGYLVIAGPLLWLALRRLKREPLLWLLLPAVALATTLGVYAVGRALRDEASVAHATLYADLPTQRLVSTQVLVTSPNGGRAGLRLADGWRQTPVAANEEVFFEGPFGEPGRLGDTPDPVLIGTDLGIDLPPGGIGVVAAETSSTTAQRSWDHDLTADDELAGTITNLTDHDLEEVFVASGQGFARIQEIEAGETAEVSLRQYDQPPINGDPMMERLWQFDPFSNRNAEGVINPGLLIDWLSSRPALRTPGYVVIVGWTRDEAGPLETTRGTEVVAGRTAYLTADRLDGRSAGMRVEFLRGWNSTRVADPVNLNECSDFPLTMRITPPPSFDATDAVLELSDRAIAAFDVWDGASWQPAGMNEATTREVVVALPAGALDEDGLYLRVQMSCEFWGMSDPFPQLRAAEPDDDVLELGALGLGVEPGDEPDDETTVTTGPPAPPVPTTESG